MATVNPQVHVLLDANSLWNGFFAKRSVALDCLSALAERFQIQLHLPTVVHGELKSQIPEAIKKTGIDLKALSALENLAPTELRPKANQIAALLSEFVAEIEAAAHSKLTNWISVSKVQIPEIKPAHTVAVFASYFSAAAPFQQAKSRDDLPDAFIYESIKDLVTEFGELFVVSRDGNLATHLKKIDGVTVYADIHALLGSGNLPVKPDEQSFALRRRLKEYREEITV